jgi:hypothetical protein
MEEKRLKHLRPLNSRPGEEEDSTQVAADAGIPVPASAKVRVPLAACDCDEHCAVDICAADDVDIDVCGLYGG